MVGFMIVGIGWTLIVLEIRYDMVIVYVGPSIMTASKLQR
jgi:hypothetical protein